MFLTLAAIAGEDGPEVPKSRELGDLSIEELMNVSVTSVAKKETPLQHSPAAIAVITSEDIRRIGATTIREALRIVPGMNVARINANKLAVSSASTATALAKAPAIHSGIALQSNLAA